MRPPATPQQRASLRCRLRAAVASGCFLVPGSYELYTKLGAFEASLRATGSGLQAQGDRLRDRGYRQTGDIDRHCLSTYRGTGDSCQRSAAQAVTAAVLQVSEPLIRARLREGVDVAIMPGTVHNIFLLCDCSCHGSHSWLYRGGTGEQVCLC